MKWEDVLMKDLSWLFALEVVVCSFIMFALNDRGGVYEKFMRAD